MNDKKEASEVLKPHSSQIEQPPASEPPEAVESQIIEQWDAAAVGNESEIMGKLPSLDMIKDETIAVEGGRYQMAESSPVRSPRVFQSLLHVINDEDEASGALRPSSSQLEEPPGVQSSDVVEPQRTEHIDAARVVNKSEISDKFPSMDVIKDEAGAREDVCCQMPDSSPTAAIHGETIHEAEALVVKDELTGGTEAIEARDSLLVDGMDYEFIREEVGALQENEEESEIEKEGQPSVVKDELTVKTEALEAEKSPRFADKDNELLRVSEGQAGKENVGESMIVMEEEWSVVVEKQGESWKGGGGEAEAELAEENDVKVEEMVFVAENGGEQIMEGEVLAEMKSVELEERKRLPRCVRHL
ncbi:hypothetical protein Nepgr_004631 [Nepenthes gracilis]|uniref:Uncharacterized protein n=1 Tax=Nepenthes gracilis TaxID=150966 RepID=A0AAD3S1P0_NEPGR|nr:hypothetical protein Nepgr_004631 [Nepenthes gracilis]